MIHPYQMTEPAQSSFTDNVLYAVLSSSRPDLFICYLIANYSSTYCQYFSIILLFVQVYYCHRRYCRCHRLCRSSHCREYTIIIKQLICFSSFHGLKCANAIGRNRFAWYVMKPSVALTVQTTVKHKNANRLTSSNL